MNKGDKIICINPYHIRDGDDFFSYKEGDIWQIEKTNRKAMITTHIFSYIEAIPISFEGESNRFSLEEMKNWIILAEWREQQMKSILDD
jgi:hypothetical protein